MRAASFKVKIGLEEHGGELVDAPGAKVGVLFPGSERGDAGDTAGLVEIKACGARSRPAVVNFQQAHAHGGE